MSAVLLPCPFCGSAKAEATTREAGESSWAEVTCSACEATGPANAFAPASNLDLADEAMAQAENDWNTRADDWRFPPELPKPGLSVLCAQEGRSTTAEGWVDTGGEWVLYDDPDSKSLGIYAWRPLPAPPRKGFA